MKQIKQITILLLGILIAAPVFGQDEPDKIGTVNMQKLLAEYHKTEQVRKDFQGYKEIVVEQDKERQEAIKKLVEQSRELRAEAENSNLARERQEELFSTIISQQREAQAMQNERVSWLERKNAAFKEKENIELSKLRKEIVEMVREEGEARGFDFIFDRSGASGSNVLILAYAKDATDLTGVMITRINRDAPEKEDEEEPETEKKEGGEE